MVVGSYKRVYEFYPKHCLNTVYPTGDKVKGMINRRMKDLYDNQPVEQIERGIQFGRSVGSRTTKHSLIALKTKLRATTPVIGRNDDINVVK
jgi:hypothetical protein